MSTVVKLVLPVMLGVCLSGCDELLEVDLDGETLEVLVPRDGFEAESRSVDFVWYQVEGASEYELFVVEPALDSIVRIAARVRTTDLSASVTLPDGSYEWQVIAENSISETGSSPRTLIVMADSTLPDAPPAAALIAPIDDEVINDNPVRLLWSPAPDSGIAYRVQLATQSFANSSFVLLDTLVRSDLLDVTLTEDGAYRWRVRPETEGSSGSYVEESFAVDRSGPVTPTLLSPNSGDIVSSPVSLSWQSSPQAVDYLLDVRSDSISGRVVVSEAIGFTTQTVTDTLAERYFWRVAARDAIGNESPPSAWSTYIIE